MLFSTSRLASGFFHTKQTTSVSLPPGRRILLLSLYISPWLVTYGRLTITCTRCLQPGYNILGPSQKRTSAREQCSSGLVVHLHDARYIDVKYQSSQCRRPLREKGNLSSIYFSGDSLHIAFSPQNNINKQCALRLYVLGGMDGLFTTRQLATLASLHQLHMIGHITGSEQLLSLILVFGSSQ